MIELPAVAESPFHFARLARAAGFRQVAGVDEAGRGPLAGPVVAAAVILSDPCRIAGLADSKTLTAKRRDELFAALHDDAGVRLAVAVVEVAEIDRLNILRATHGAMRTAAKRLAPNPDLALIDGRPVPGFPCPSRSIVKGDAACACISAASIIAKVTRDRLMCELDKRYPQYGFARHKGYGTAAHLAALAKYGPCPAHRRSFRPVAEALAPPPVQGEFGF